MRNIQILSATELAHRSFTIPAAFQLRFPPSWRASPVQNRYADAIARETLRWLGDHGIGHTPEQREKREKFNCGMYGGYSLPLADYHTGLLVTQFISLWLFWDDVQVEDDLGWSVDAVVAALTGAAAPAPGNRYLAAWASLGARLRTSSHGAPRSSAPRLRPALDQTFDLVLLDDRHQLVDSPVDQVIADDRR
jgi:hypothetical protein